MSNPPLQTDNERAPATKVLVVVGPTAVGKSALAENLAVRLDGELVSADSMQVYRGMDIGTAKTPVGQRVVPLHGIDLVDPGEPFSAAMFQSYGRDTVDELVSRGLLPVVVGGTGLYVRALIDDMHFPAGEQTGNEVRACFERFAEENGAQALHDLLAEKDPAAASLIHPNNVKRVVRALEMLEEGVSYAEQHAGFSRRESIYRAFQLGLTMDREQLYRRVDERVDAMVESGLVEEVARLLDAGLRDALTAQQAIGYKEIVPVVEGRATLDSAVAQIKQASRRYAKRQLTWFRADPRVHWLDVTELSLAEQTEAAIAAIDWEPQLRERM